MSTALTPFKVTKGNKITPKGKMMESKHKAKVRSQAQKSFGGRY